MRSKTLELTEKHGRHVLPLIANFNWCY